MAVRFWLYRWAARMGVLRWLPGVQRRSAGAGEFLPYYSDRALAAPLDDLPPSLDPATHFPPDGIDLTTAVPMCDGIIWPRFTATYKAHVRGTPDLCRGITQHLAGLGTELDHATNEILVTHGATGALGAAMDALLNPGDSVLLLDPCSPAFVRMLRHRRVSIRWVETQREQGQIRVHHESLRQALRGAKMLLVCDPNNPTGLMLAPEDLEQMAFWAQRRDVLIVSDESFLPWASAQSPLRFASIPAARNRTLTIGSVGLACGVPGLRVGWLGGHRHLVRPCAVAQQASSGPVSTWCQQAALAALRTDLAAQREQMSARRQFAYERLRAMGLAVDWPVAGWFLWTAIPNAQPDVEQTLVHHNVLLTPGSGFGPSGEGFVRLSVAGSEGRLLEGLSRLARLPAETSASPIAA